MAQFCERALKGEKGKATKPGGVWKDRTTEFCPGTDDHRGLGGWLVVCGEENLNDFERGPQTNLVKLKAVTELMQYDCPWGELVGNFPTTHYLPHHSFSPQQYEAPSPYAPSRWEKYLSCTVKQRKKGWRVGGHSEQVEEGAEYI